MYSLRSAAGTALIVFVYLALGLTNVFTRAPWCDEAWFGNPAYNLAYKGFMGTTILDRLMHRAVMLEFEGKSYRLKEAAARIALNTAEVH